MVTAYLRWSDHLVALSHGSVLASYIPMKWSSETDWSGGDGSPCARVTTGILPVGSRTERYGGVPPGTSVGRRAGQASGAGRRHRGGRRAIRRRHTPAG